MFTIRNLKALPSGAYTASIYRDGKRWATLEDDGRGGEPRIYPPSTGYQPKPWQGVDATQADLHNWALSSLPDWYLSGHGRHEPLEPTWELAVGYLVEVAENNRAAKKGVLVRKDDGEYYVFSHLDAASKAGLVWNGTDWVDLRTA